MTIFNDEDKKIGIIEKISLWYRFDGRHIPRNIMEGIKNIIYWFPIIWKDRNWDQSFIYEVLKHKLKAQANYIDTKDRHTRAKQDARRMRLCVSLIQICQDDTYNTEYMDYAETDFWFEDVEDKPGYSTIKSDIIWEKYDDYFKKYPLIYKRVMNGEGVFSLEGRDDDKQVIAMNIGHINQDRAHKLLFKILESNINSWWD
jgi:hypothetical protein